MPWNQKSNQKIGPAGQRWNYDDIRELMIEDLLQPRHLLVILVVAVFLFGPKKLPELGKGLAEGIRSFKDAFKAGSSHDSV